MGRYEVRNMIMGSPGAVAPVVFGGKVRAVMVYLDRQKMQARNLSPLDVMNALDEYNVFLPTRRRQVRRHRLRASTPIRCIDMSTDMGDIPLRIRARATPSICGDVATPKDANFIQTNVVRVNGKREVYIPVFRQLGASTLRVVSTLERLAQGHRRHG